MKLAQKIEANLLLCNVYEVPADEKNTDRKAWPMRACEENSINDLSDLAMRLKAELDKEDDINFKPDIQQCSEEGLVGDRLNDLAANHEVLLELISMHSANNLTNFLKTNNAWNIIENATFPVMVIPYQVRFKDYKLIAFATAINDNNDVNILESLSGLAKYTDSQIMLTHISNENSDDYKEETMIKQFFSQIPSKNNYTKIIYHNIKSDNVTVSLKWLSVHTDIDLLVLVHQKRSLFQKVFNRSVTQKLAEYPGKPLLIFPCASVNETLTVF